MRIYEITDDRNLPVRGYVKAEHNWFLPATVCPECELRWGITGLEYPCVTIEPTIGKYFKEGGVSWHNYLKLKEWVPKSVPLVLPGTEFGPLRGVFCGSLDVDVHWAKPWTVLMKSSALHCLERLVNAQSLSRSRLKYPKRTKGDLIELQIDPLCKLHRRSFVNEEVSVCETCGRNSQEYRETIVIRTSIPKDTHIFRPLNFPTLILVTEKFKDISIECNLTNIRFREVEAT